MASSIINDYNFQWLIVVSVILTITESYQLQLALKGDATPYVYVLCGGYRQNISDWDAFSALGYSSSDVLTIPELQLNAIPLGPSFILNPNSIGKSLPYRTGRNDGCPVANSSITCINSAKDVSNALEGVWFDALYDFTAHLPRSTDGWAFNECPAQSELWSCYRHNSAWNKDSHGYKAESKLFQPFGCSLKTYNPYDFLKALSGKRLLIGTDSTSAQLFETIVCSLHGFVKAIYDIEWYNEGRLCHMLASHQCHILTGTVEYPQFNATIVLLQTHITMVKGKLHGDHDITDYVEYGNLAPTDILLLNFGVHFDDPVKYKIKLEEFVRGFHSTRDLSISPVLIWRETGPQHFATSSGYYLQEGSRECAPFKNMTWAYESDWRNRVAEEIFIPLQVPILRVWGPSAHLWDGHIIDQDRLDEPGLKDCTHFCVPSGVLYFWRELLFNTITVLNKV